MRLIDADRLRKKLLMMECMEDVVEIIDNEPTAYDIDKVVEKLEEIPREYNFIANAFQRGATSGASWMKKRAIEIVKDGGKNE